MKQFSCGDVVPGCDKTMQAGEEPRLLSLMQAHAREDHGMDDIPSDVLTTIRRAIVTV